MISRFNRHVRVAAFAAGLIGAVSQMHAQTKFDNGTVGFDVPNGWTAQTSLGGQGSVRMKADTSVDTILVHFDDTLPANLVDAGKVMEAHAISDVAGLFTPALRFTVETPCPGQRTLEVDVDGHQAVQCETWVKDTAGFTALVEYTAVLLEGRVCLIVGFAPGEKNFVGALLEADKVMSSRLQFHASSSWKTFTSSDFSFRYPAQWKLFQAPDEEYWAGDGAGRTVSVKFIRGFVNRKDTFNQCASEDELLDIIYHRDYEGPYEKNVGRGYPYTTVTHDDYKPGLLGGKSTWFSITQVEAYENQHVSVQSWVDIVPRKTGVYIVTYTHPSEDMAVSEPLRQGFAKSINFTSPTLDKGAYCNYLGK